MDSMTALVVDGARLYYERSGVGGAGEPAVLLLHGLGSSARDWRLQLGAFGERFRVVALDLRGHGRSSRGVGRLTVERMADDVAAVHAELAEPPAHIVGLSLGACVALALARRAPQTVRSLTLVNAFARLTPAGTAGAVRMFARLGLLLVAPMPTVAAHVARGLFPRPDQREHYLAAVESLARNRKRTYLAAVRALLEFDVRAGLEHVRCPTLVVAGDRDTTVPLAAKTLLSRRIPGARLLVVADSGHVTNVDQADVFNRAVLEFVAAH
jgi:3-oxoadipate enol-lactonase